MTPQEMWIQYTTRRPDAASASWDAWAFGDKPDQLATLTLSGVKTATSSARTLYELDGEPLPQVGEHSIILNSQGEAVCIIRNTKVRILPYCDVDERHARLEGEGNMTLTYWREIHESFFRRELAQYGLPFTKDLAVVCEEFEVVFP